MFFFDIKLFHLKLIDIKIILSSGTIFISGTFHMSNKVVQKLCFNHTHPWTSFYFSTVKFLQNIISLNSLCRTKNTAIILYRTFKLPKKFYIYSQWPTDMSFFSGNPAQHVIILKMTRKLFLYYLFYFFLYNVFVLVSYSYFISN